jgi:hypothetical protein
LFKGFRSKLTKAAPRLGIGTERRMHSTTFVHGLASGGGEDWGVLFRRPSSTSADEMSTRNMWWNGCAERTVLQAAKRTCSPEATTTDQKKALSRPSGNDKFTFHENWRGPTCPSAWNCSAVLRTSMTTTPLRTPYSGIDGHSCETEIKYAYFRKL